MFPTRPVLRVHAAVALVVMTFSTSACDFFTTRPLGPDFANSYVEVPDVLAKYAPELPPLLYARARALDPSLSTGSVMGDAINGLRLSTQPMWPSAIDLAAVTPAPWVSDYGTGLQYIDDDTTPQALPFAFSFYGQSYSSVYVSANGHISFGNPIQFKRTWNIPDGANVLAAPAFADWMPASRFSYPNLQNSRVYVNTVGQPGDRRFVVTWHDMRPCCSLSYPGSSFQLHLLERTGEIVFAFREMQMVVSNASTGIAADAQRYVRTATGQGVLALQGCVITYTPNSGSYREANSCAPAPVNVPPAVQVGGPYAGDEGSEISVSGSATDDNGGALTYSWDLGDGTTMAGQSVAHSYVDNGAYPASLSVSDGELVTVATTRVDVSNVRPSLEPLSAASIFVGDAHNVSLLFNDAGANDAPWHWTISWGDGAMLEGDGTSRALPIELSHVYMAPGAYTVHVTVKDKDQDLASAEAQVEVKKDEVAIDVKPWDPNNRIRLKGRWDKRIAVAVLSNERLDASTVDVSTVKLGSIGVMRYWNDDDDDEGGSAGSTPSYRYLASLYDIDHDGDNDLVVLFERKAMVKAGELSTSTTSLTLTGVSRVSVAARSSGEDGGGTVTTTIVERKIAGVNPVQVVK
jgi:PKD repeat protein